MAGIPRSHLAVSEIEPRQSTVLLCLTLVAATLAFYNPLVQNHFIAFDDSPYIVANPQVQQGLTWDTVKWAFTTFHAGYWHPLTWLSHALDCQVFHLNPSGHHYVNLLIHALNAVLLFLLLRGGTGRTVPSFFVGLLFALHPVNVESVAWAAERKNVLSMMFFLLAMLAYDRYAHTKAKSLYFSVVICFALGLMAKPQIVTLPFVLLLWDYWPLQRIGVGERSSNSISQSGQHSLRFLLFEKLSLFFLAAADSFVIILAQRAGSAIRTAAEVAFPLRIENAVASYVRYLRIGFWPTRLAPMYPRPVGFLPVWQVVASAALLIAMSAVVWYRRDQRYLTVGWLWFLGTLVPMIGIITVGEQAMADRFAYIPFIGLFIAVVWTVDAFVPEQRMLRSFGVGSAAVVVLVLGALTYRQVGYWHDDETLWRYTLSVTNDNYMAHTNLAFALAESGRPEEAIQHFRAARALHQYPANQIVELGRYELRMGFPQQAIDECQAALKSPSLPGVQEAALDLMGRAFLDLKQYDKAAESFRGVLSLAPDDADALVNGGLLALQSGDPSLAIRQFSRAVQVDPSDVNFLLLGQALRRNGQRTDADDALAHARRLSHNLVQSQEVVAQILAIANLKPI